MTKILITEFINQNSLENLNKKFDVMYDEKLCENEKQLITMVKDYDGLIVRNKTQVNSNILKNALKLKFIGRLGVGLDNIDTDYCKNKKKLTMEELNSCGLTEFDENFEYFYKIDKNNKKFVYNEGKGIIPFEQSTEYKEEQNYYNQQN